VAPLSCDPDGPLAAEVVKTTTDPYLGRVSYVRVFSGTLRPDMPVHVSGHGDSGAWHRPDHPDHDVDERVGALSSPLGATLRTVAAGPAGDLVAVARLGSAETGDTLSNREDPLLVAPWDLPEPQLPVAVQADARSDEERLGQALSRLVAEDPTLRLERRVDTGQQLLWCMGTAHADVVLDRLRVRHGLSISTPEVQVPQQATLAKPVTVTGRHVKQSGGHGQYAVVVLELAPGEPGSGVVFSQRVVGGSVPGAYHGSVEKGVRQQAATGVDGSGPLVDLAVVLVDGKAHSVDSSDAAFQAAGALAVREAVAAAGTLALEPWCEIAVTVPTAFVGTVMSDLSGRRARVTGNDPCPDDDDRSVVRAALPEVELLTYATSLRGVSHGTGSFTRRPLGFEPART
jgi:elongation factor G